MTSSPYSSPHVQSSKITREEKLKRLRTWKHWRKQGYKGALLIRKTKLSLTRVREWAEELSFDLEGLA